MLKRLSHQKATAEAPVCILNQNRPGRWPEQYDIEPGNVELPVSGAEFPSPFAEGLEYSSPARGTWNILHTGMMIPESHHIFVCAKGCLRGVVLTAAEMDAMGRYSAIEIREENVVEGGFEELMLDGVSDVLDKLPYRPKVILLYISCQHFFLAYDQDYVYDRLREKFPDIDFIDCYMIPTLRKSGISPDQKMRMQLYEKIRLQEKDEKQINVIGSDLRIDDSCEVYELIREAGFHLTQIQDCRTYEEYQNMGKAPLNLFLEPLARRSVERLKERLDQEYRYLPYTYDYDRIDQGYAELAEYMGCPSPELAEKRREAEQALRDTKDLLGDVPIAVDYSFTFLILSFSRLLLEHGFNLKEIFVDDFYPEEKNDFLWIREHYPELLICACRRPEQRVHFRERPEKYLAIGQKAAWFSGTDYFVNVVESGGYLGYGGIVEIARLMRESYLEKKDRKVLIQKKGYGCLSLV